MSVSKQDQHDRILAYQAATTLTYTEMEQVAGGNNGLYWTIGKSAAAAKMVGAEPRCSMDSNWDY